MENGHIIERQFQHLFLELRIQSTERKSPGESLIDGMVLLLLGYGHITPKTPLGQGITIIFYAFGILENDGGALGNFYQVSCSQNRNCYS